MADLDDSRGEVDSEGTNTDKSVSVATEEGEEATSETEERLPILGGTLATATKLSLNTKWKINSSDKEKVLKSLELSSKRKNGKKKKKGKDKDKEEDDESDRSPIFIADIFHDFHPLPIDNVDLDQWCMPLVLPVRSRLATFPAEHHLVATYVHLRHNLQNLLLIVLTFKYNECSSTTAGITQLKEAYLATEVVFALAIELKRFYKCPANLCWAAAYTSSGIKNQSWQVELALLRYIMFVLSLQMCFHQNQTHRPLRALLPSPSTEEKVIAQSMLESYTNACIQQLNTFKDEWKGANGNREQPEYHQLELRGMLPRYTVLERMETIILLLRYEWRIFHMYLPLFKSNSSPLYATVSHGLKPVQPSDSFNSNSLPLPMNYGGTFNGNGSTGLVFKKKALNEYCKYLYNAQECAKELLDSIFQRTNQFVDEGNSEFSFSNWRNGGGGGGSGAVATANGILNRIKQMLPFTKKSTPSDVLKSTNLPIAEQFFLQDIYFTQLVKYVFQSKYVYRLMLLSTQITVGLLEHDTDLVRYSVYELDEMFNSDPYLQLFINNLNEETEVTAKMKEDRESLNLPPRRHHDMPNHPQFTSMPVSALQTDWAFKAWGLRTFAQFHPSLIEGIAELVHEIRDIVGRQYSSINDSLLDVVTNVVPLEKQYPYDSREIRVAPFALCPQTLRFLEQVIKK